MVGYIRVGESDMKAMGRKKLIKTKNQRDNQRKRWAAARNKRRRDKYAQDAEYRRQQIEAAKEYSQRNSKEHTRYQACEQSLLRIESLGEVREMMHPLGHVAGTMRCLTSREMAEAIGLSNLVVLNKWQRSGKFPYPTIPAKVAKTRANVYTMAQTERILKIMREHYRTTDILSDGETTAKLHNAMR